MTLDEMKRLKKERGYTYAQLSEYTGVPLGTIQKIFTGETESPRYATRKALEKIFEAEPDLNGKDPDGGIIREACTYMPEDIRQGEYTLADYYTQPDDRRIELIDGVIYDMTAPAFVHQRIAGEIFYQFSDYIRKQGGACIPMTAPVDVRLDCDDRTMVQPDFLVLCDRSKIKKWGILGAPDFIAEIISPSTRGKDCIRKLNKYLDAGVKEYWIIDPYKKRLTTYDFSGEDWPEIYELDGKTGVGIFAGRLMIDLSPLRQMIRDWPDE